MQVSQDWNVGLDVAYYGSDYSFFGDAIFDVDLEREVVTDVYWKNLTVVDCNGDDVFYLGSRFPGDLNPVDGFVYDMAVEVALRYVAEEVIDHVKSTVYKNGEPNRGS